MKNTFEIEKEVYLAEVQAKADKIVDKFVIAFFIFGILLASMYETWQFSLSVGSLNVLLYVLSKFITNKLLSRQVVSSVFSIFMLQFIGQGHGMAEFHFFFFTNIAILIIYQDWRIMIPYTVFAIAHHSIFFYFQLLGFEHLGEYFINYTTVNLVVLFFHFGIAILMAVIAGWWSIIFRNQSIQMLLIQEEMKAKNHLLLKNEEELKQNIEELHSTQDTLNLILSQNTAITKALYDSAIVSIANKKGEIIKINTIFEQISGYTQDELIGKDHKIVNSGFHDKSFWIEMWQTVSMGKTWRAEVCNRAKDGSLYWVDTVINPIKNGEGDIYQYLSIRYLITKRKNAESELLSKNLKQKMLNEILALSLKTTEDIDQFFYESIDVLSQASFLNHEPGIGIFIKNGDDTFALRAHKSLSPQIQTACAKIKLGECLCGLAALKKETQYAHCVDERHTTTFEGIKQHGHYNVPIMFDDEVIGVIVVYLKHGHQKNENEIRFLENVAMTFAETIVRLEDKAIIKQKNIELKASLEELQSTQDELSNFKERLSFILQKTGIGIWEMDLSTKKQKWDSQSKKIFDIDENVDIVTNEDWLNLIVEEDRSILESENKKIFGEEGKYDATFRIKTDYNALKYVRSKASLMRDAQGDVHTIVGTLEDITSTKLQELQNAQLSLVASKTDNGVVITNHLGQVEWVNQGFEGMTGYFLPEVKGRKLSLLQGAETNPKHVRNIREGLASRQSFSQEILNYSKTGEPYWLELNITPIFKPNGEITQFIGIERDITQNKFLLERIEKQNLVLREKIDHVAQMQRESEDARIRIQKLLNDLTSSINYAQRIQKAILPSEQVLKEHLPDSFVFFKPKDIVSGDFYWFADKGDTKILVVGDCTGHGVPGALMTMVANDILNRIVHDYEIYAPNEIIDLMPQLLEKTLANSHERVRDGLDIVIITLYMKNQRVINIDFAGAMNPIYFIKNNEIDWIKGDKVPIMAENKKIHSYTKHSIPVDETTMIYLVSDGYQDQFGGDNFSKYKVGAFRNLLSSLAKLPIEEQKNALENEFLMWKGLEKQTDDVLVLGIKIN